MKKEYIGLRFDSLIKPSDNWNFSPVRYPRLENGKSHGYIPGDIYANCFWYYAKAGDVVVDPMAGSGMAKVVYEDRESWMGTHIYDFDLQIFDLTPEQPYIRQHNLLESFPVSKPDYVFIDLPYYGMVNKVYSHHEQDLANMGLEEYVSALYCISKNCAAAQMEGKKCTVVSPNYRNTSTGEIIMITMHIIAAWQEAGYFLYDKAYSSRRIQKAQNTGMAVLNNVAKASRVMLTDISEILTFQKR